MLFDWQRLLWLDCASIVTNQCVYEEFYGYLECRNVVFVLFFLSFGHSFVLLSFPLRAYV